MNCQEFIHLLEVMPLPDRTPAEMDTLHEHAHQCPACAQRLLAISNVEHDLAQLMLVSAPTELSANIMNRLTTAPSAPPASAKPRVAGLFWWVTSSVAALVAIPVCLHQAGLATGWKQLFVPHATPQVVSFLRHLLAAEPGHWILGLAALLTAIAIVAQHEERLRTAEGVRSAR